MWTSHDWFIFMYHLEVGSAASDPSSLQNLPGLFLLYEVLVSGWSMLHIYPGESRWLLSAGNQTWSLLSGQSFCVYFSVFFFFLIFHLFMRDTERQRHRKEKQAPHREPDVGLNSRPWDHALSQRQMLNH